MKITPAGVVAAGVLLGAAGAGIYGIGRSLWLDEAWVANSLHAPSLDAMFFRTEWLQVNPPLFLLLARSAIRVFGFSNVTLRLTPLALSMAAVGAMLVLARRVLSPAFAVLACALLAFHPNVLEYARTLKPYSGELAATTFLLLAAILYAERPDRNRFLGLLAAVMFALPLAYPAVFLIPGVLLMAYFNGVRNRFVFLAAASGGVFLLVYGIFIRPNYSPALREFFRSVADSGLSAGVLAALLFTLAVSAQVVLQLRRAKPGCREWTLIVCLLPCLLLAVTGAFGWYPISHRTRLFVLPCFILILTMGADEFVRRLKLPLDGAVLILTLAIAGAAIGNQVKEHRNLAEEDMAGAVRFLQDHVGPADLVVVHPSVREGFLLYAAMNGWRMPPVVYSDTGWPCCQRGRDPKPGGSREEEILKDLDSRIPRGFSGRAWLYFTTRPTHWTYVGMKEQDTWKRFFWEGGCLAGPYFAFENQGISPMDCPGLKPRRYTVVEVKQP